MTDARLPGYWLTEMRFSDLTDKQWRVFTGLLMWSNEQATDGHVPARYIKAAHPDGVDESDIDALVACDVLKRTDTGLQMLRWEDPRGLRQSTAAQVEKFRQSRREIQAAYRKRQKEKTVTGHVGEGNKHFDSTSSAYGTGNETGHVTGNARRPASWTTAPAQTMQTVQPGSDCGPGNHLIAGGVCSLCEARDF